MITREGCLAAVAALLTGVRLALGAQARTLASVVEKQRIPYSYPVPTLGLYGISVEKREQSCMTIV